MLMMLLGIEVLTETTHIEGGCFLRGACFSEEYTCWYWTGTGYRYQVESPYGFTACPVWRWGRQVPE